MSAACSIGRFEIRRELGRGAQSVVYLAWDPQLLREVAIKTLHFVRADPLRNAELLNEARTTSRFRHPNVVPIFDLGEQDGQPFLVFERVEGRSLDAVLKEDGPLPPAKAASLMHAVTDALAQAHAQGIIHRDLKPSNILIDQRDGSARVMDFGIAMRLSDANAAPVKDLSGTPLYMAPEYVGGQPVTAQIDVYAAGLVLLEMLTGKRAREGSSLEAILHRVLTEPVVLPAEPPIDVRLGGIALRACAHDPALRFANAAELRDALADYLGDAGCDLLEGEGAVTHQDTLDFLLRRMRHKADFPALASSVSAINRLTESAAGNANALAGILLKDYALTNKILRLVNSAHYRQAGGGRISTVSRAVIVLGFDTIRNLAMTVLLFEHLQNKSNANELKEAFLRANLAGMLARKSCQIPLLRQHGEEAYICALFHDLGHLLVEFYFPEEAEEIRKLMAFKKLSLRAASTQVLGLSSTELGIGIAGRWGFPREIVESMRELPEGPLRKPQTTSDALHTVAGFANELCSHVSAASANDCGRIAARAAHRFGASLQMDSHRLQTNMHQALKDLAEIAGILQLNARQSPIVKLATQFAGSAVAADEAEKTSASQMADQMAHTLLDQSSAIPAQAAARASRLPDDAQSILAAGIQDISNSLVDDFALNDMLRMVLETMYRGIGFDHVALALRDAPTGAMTARLGLGPAVDDLLHRFRFKLTDQMHDVFELACGKGLDIIIHDIDDAKIANKVPVWFRTHIPARTFVLLPLTIKGRCVALIYCDKSQAGSITIPEKELTLLKTLRNQALLAIKQAA